MPSSPHWADIGELGFVSGMRFLFWVYRCLGPRAFTVAVQPAVLYYFLTNRIARTSSREFLQRLDGSTGVEDVSWKRVYSHLNTFAQLAVDKLGVWAHPASFDPVKFPNRKILLDQLDTGRGAVLLGAHLGNMEICRCFSRSTAQLKLNILVHTGHADRFNLLLRKLHLNCELELIEVSQLSPATAIRLSAGIERGEFVVILADRIPVGSLGRYREIEFLGAMAPFPEGPFILASLLKCPVYTLFCTRGGAGYEIRCEKFADQVFLPRRNRDEALEAYISRFVTILEKNLRLTPLQWSNFYHFWDQTI